MKKRLNHSVFYRQIWGNTTNNAVNCLGILVGQYKSKLDQTFFYIKDYLFHVIFSYIKHKYSVYHRNDQGFLSCKILTQGATVPQQ